MYYLPETKSSSVSKPLNVESFSIVVSAIRFKARGCLEYPNPTRKPGTIPRLRVGLGLVLFYPPFAKE